MHEANSLLRTAKWDGRQELLHYRVKKIETKEEKNIKYLFGWGHIINLIWGEKEQNNACKAQHWMVFQGLADWRDCISVQADHL